MPLGDVCLRLTNRLTPVNARAASVLEREVHPTDCVVRTELVEIVHENLTMRLRLQNLS